MTSRAVHDYIKTCYTGTISDTFCLCSIMLLPALFVCLAVNACHGPRRQMAHNPTAKPALSANPNPIPAGDPDQSLGSTEIIWNTGDGTKGDLYVKENRSPERFLARATAGQLKIDWIQFDATYEFLLYPEKHHGRPLARLEVTREN